MSSSRTSPMKDAFKKLQVQAPYRLPKDGPGFIPPLDSPTKDVTSTPGVPNPRTPLPEVETTIGRIDARSPQPEVILTKGEFDQKSELPMVNPTKGCSDQTSIAPEVTSTISKTRPQVRCTFGRNYHGSRRPKGDPTRGNSYLWFADPQGRKYHSPENRGESPRRVFTARSYGRDLAGEGAGSASYPASTL
jgi:hypothetical protein